MITPLHDNLENYDMIVLTFLNMRQREIITRSLKQSNGRCTGQFHFEQVGNRVWWGDDYDDSPHQGLAVPSLSPNIPGGRERTNDGKVLQDHPGK